MTRRGRLAIAVALAGQQAGLRLAKVNYQLGWWTYKVGQKAAHLLMLPERRRARRAAR